MSDIAPVSSASLLGAVSSVQSEPRSRQRDEISFAAAREGDAVELSPLARFVALARENPVREELIGSVREEIANGTYDTDEKLSKALDELLSDFR